MKKWLFFSLISLLILIVACIIFLPYAAGWALEKQYPKLLKTLSSSGFIELKLINYQRHWFESQATLQVKVTHSNLTTINEWLHIENNPSPLQFIITQEIEHGPLLRISTISGKTRWLLGQALLKSQIISPIGNIDSLSLVRLNRSFFSVATAPVLHYHNSNVDLKITGLTENFQLSSDLNHIVNHTNIPIFQIETNNYNQEVKGFDTHSYLHRSHSGLLLGSKVTEITSVVWLNKDVHSYIQLHKLSSTLSSLEQNDKINYQFNGGIDKITIDNINYGPQRLRFTFKNLDTSSLLTFMKKLKLMQVNANASTPNLAEYRQLFMALLNKGFELDVNNFNIVTAWGNAQLNAKIILIPQIITATTTHLTTFLHYLDANIQAQFPQPFLTLIMEKYKEFSTEQPIAESKQQAQQQINEWIQRRFLISNGSYYYLNFTYKNDKGFINDRPLNGSTAAH